MQTKNLLIDIDGVLRLGETELVPGALEAIDYIRKNEINHLFVTNGTRASRETVVSQLQKLGFDIKEDEMFTAPVATAMYINSIKQGARIFLIAEGDTEKDFEGHGIKVVRKEEPVDFVVIGYDRELDYEKLSIAFRLLVNGAELIAMNIDKRFKREDGLFYPAAVLASAGLKACTDKEYVVIGKPQKPFFETAMKKLNAEKDDTVMIGDFLEGDIIGAKNSGIQAIMVKTGSYNEDDVNKSEIKPDHVIDSIKDLPELLEGLL
jgi:HAD superfamily hydrolase (TIGR01458 family)